MDKELVKDYSATGVGAASGLDMLYAGIEGMLNDGADTPEIKLVIYGLISIITGFFAWRRRKQDAPASA